MNRSRSCLFPGRRYWLQGRFALAVGRQSRDKGEGEEVVGLVAPGFALLLEDNAV